MKHHKNHMKLALLSSILIGIPTIASATYSDCIRGGGSAWECFWEAAFKDGGPGTVTAPSSGGVSTQASTKYNKKQIRHTFEKNKKICLKLPLDKQFSCLSKGLHKPIKKVNKSVHTKAVSHKIQ